MQSLLAHERSPCATDEALIATNIEHAHMHLPDHIDLSRCPLAVQLTHNPPARCPQPSAPRAPSRSLWFCQGSYGPAKSALSHRQEPRHSPAPYSAVSRATVIPYSYRHYGLNYSAQYTRGYATAQISQLISVDSGKGFSLL